MYRHEVPGRYLWSPKRKANGQANAFYDFMREVAPGDVVFDRGFIGFEDNGDVLVSPVAHAASLVKLGVQVTQTLNVGRFSEGQRRYLRFHRESVLLRSKYLEEA
jgi:hypothetical protein